MLNNSRTSTFNIQLVKLRIVVLALGETQHFGWWKSQFLSQTGVSFLDRIFPRTKFSAAIQSSSLVARLAHDLSIGRGDLVHLFRMPSLEEQLEEYQANNANELQDYFFPKLNDREQLLMLLSKMADGYSVGKQKGPARITKSQWGDLQLLASIYLQGFKNKTPVFPYVGE